mgnify:CR=1 FL=1|jgi:hypothetical protein
MLLKILIVVLLLALVVSLFSGFYFLMTDQGDKSKRRTVNSLGVRVSLAVCLIGVIVYAVATGQISSQAPWDNPRPNVGSGSTPETEAAPQGAPPSSSGR